MIGTTRTRAMSDPHAPDSPFPDTVVVENVVCYSRDDAARRLVVRPGGSGCGARRREAGGATPGLSRIRHSPARRRVDRAARAARAGGGGGEQGGGWAAPCTFNRRPATVRQVSLETIDDHGTSSVLATCRPRPVFRHTGPSSGWTLKATATTAAVAALNGRRGCLAIRYRVAVPLKASVRAQVEGDAEEALVDAAGRSVGGGDPVLVERIDRGPPGRRLPCRPRDRPATT